MPVAPAEMEQEIELKNPNLWSIDAPYMYKVESILKNKETGEVLDRYYTPTGIRTFRFDAQKGFILNGEQVKINGVCMHHDLGCLGAAVNTRAIERQLEILKEWVATESVVPITLLHRSCSTFATVWASS